MTRYTFKTYIAHEQEHYLYSEQTLGEAVAFSETVPFPESLMSLLYMDLDPIEAIIQKLNDEFWKLAVTKEEQHHQNALALLDDLASRHIYFQQFRLDMNCRLTHAKLFNSYTEDVLPRAYLYHLPEKLRQMQAQILELIQHVLDTDQESEETVPQKMVSYYKAAGDRAFRFCAQPVSFELIDDEVFAEVLEPEVVYDLIDCHLRECIKREVKMRVCKNCGRYFALTGRTNTEYCSRPFDEKGRTCREVGAIALWTKRKSGDTLFRDYRREYKKRFARMKAGKLEPEELYAWGERAREKKAECEAGKLSPEDYAAWLRES